MPRISFKAEQNYSMEAVYDSHDVFIGLPTGFGKRWEESVLSSYTVGHVLETWTGRVAEASIILIRIFCVCVRVRVFVISEISLGGRSATLFTPMWRASLGELQRLLLELTWRMVREEKPLEVFRW